MSPTIVEWMPTIGVETNVLAAPLTGRAESPVGVVGISTNMLLFLLLLLSFKFMFFPQNAELFADQFSSGHNVGTQGQLKARSSVSRVVKDRREGLQCQSSGEEKIFLLASKGKITISASNEMRA